MTAYKNRKAALAVTAGLVGALTLGGAVVAPAAVYAQTGAEMQADWNAGAKVTKATNGKGQQVKDPSKAVFAKGKGKYLVPTEVTNRFGTSYDLTKAEDYVFQYKKLGGTETVEVKNGKFKKADEFFANADAGTYTVAVAKKGDTANFTVVARFTIDQLSLEGAKVEGAVTFSGETFNEAFQAGTIKVVDAKGNALSADLTSGDFDVNFIYNADGTAYAAGPDGLMAAGNYKVQISSKNDYTGKAVIDVAVSKLGLSKAVVTVDDDNYASGEQFPGSFQRESIRT